VSVSLNQDLPLTLSLSLSLSLSFLSLEIPEDDYLTLEVTQGLVNEDQSDDPVFRGSEVRPDR
jgi:hypothetical protein